MRKSIFVILLFFLLWQPNLQEFNNSSIVKMSIQESHVPEEESAGQEPNSEIEDSSVLPQGFIFITAGPQLLYNAEGLNTAPSPVSFSIGTGGNIPLLKKYISFSPYLKGWASYYIWYNDKAVPGTIEKRTSYTLHALLDIPVIFHIPVKTSIFSLGLGISILARYGFAVSVLPEEEKPDIKKMNTYYWQKMRFLYPCLILSWDYMLDNGTSFGFEVRGHYPVSSAIDEVPSPLQAGLLSVSGRFFFPRIWKQ